MRNRFKSVLLGSVVLANFALPAAAQDQAAEEAAASEETIIVTGTRRLDRTIADSPVPVDVISADALTNTGYTETNKLLNQLVPSFNFPQPSITDGTDVLRPATLRGLSPDQTLVLINGKRRHTSALLNINGSVGRGSAAVDINTIPPLALERVEVLRDGASSQYGSDAIAGVINFQLRKAEGGRAQITYGKYVTSLEDVPEVTGVQTPPALSGGILTLLDTGKDRKARDGETLTLATNVGLPLGDAGYFNVTAEYKDRDPTNRAGYDPRQQYFNLADPRELTFNRLSHRYGDAKTADMTFFVNAGVGLGETAELYAFGSLNLREGESAGFYRRANDARNRDYAASAVAPFVPFYPDGFLPLIVSDTRDVSGAIGVRGEVADWNYDVSWVYGSNKFALGVENSFNTSLGGLASPVKFDAGELHFGQHVVNVDLQRELAVGFAKSLSLAFGGEYRNENFKIVAGDLASYVAGPFSNPPTSAPAGAQVFPGFQPGNEVDATRDSFAAYVELDADLNDRVSVQLAGRYEHYSDFGDTLNGKIAVRFEASDWLAFRGSASTGFRAPSLHQQFFAASATNNIGGTLVEVGTFAVDSAVAQALGSVPLDPEESVNFSGGITLDPFDGFSLTADYYNIKINDRIVLTENLQGAAVVALLQAAGINNVSSARFFINGIDTRTQGVDVVASYRTSLGDFGRFGFTAGYNYNTTKITDRVDTLGPLATIPGLVLFGRVESLRFERGQPRSKVNLGVDWDKGILGATLRTNRFGSVIATGNTTATDVRLSPKWVTDAELRLKPLEAVEFAIGANNIFDVYPDRLPAGGAFGVNAFFLPYSSFSPFGFNGRFIYGRVSVEF